MDPNANIERIRAATLEVFTTMLGIDLEVGEAHMDVDPAPSAEGVVALIGLAGEWIGTGSLCCSAAFARRIASHMLMIEAAAVDGEVLDAVAEVTNMIIGNVKTSLELKCGPMGMSIPTIIFGKNFSARSAGHERWITVPFFHAGEKLEVKLCLTPNRGPHVSPPSYSLQGIGTHHAAVQAQEEEEVCKQPS